MKYLLISLCLTASCFVVHAQSPTVIPPSTTIEAFSALTAGQYRFFGSVTKDTVDLSIDKSLVCAPCPACPPPVVCPPPPKQRTAVAVTVTITASKKNILITYDDGTTSTL